MRRGGKGTDKREMIRAWNEGYVKVREQLVVVKMGPNSVLTLKARPLW